jgi:hypothetical protein
MRRWAWRGALVIVVMVAMLATTVGVRAFNRACDGSLEGLRYLANVRTQIAVATALPPAPPQAAPAQAQTQAQTQAQAQAPPVQSPPVPAPPSVAQRALEVVGMAGDAAIVALVRIKQDDAVAYPAHIVAAHALNVAGCGKDAVRLQWLKAGLHASRDGQPERIAAALEASATDPDDLAELRRIVRTWTERARQSVSLRRVLAALDERS